MKPQKKLKTYNVTYRPDENNRYKTKTITYQANDMKQAEALFHAEHPEYKNNKTRYLEIHSPLSNYAIDRENEKSAETSTTDGDTTTTTTPVGNNTSSSGNTTTSTTTTTTTTTMKKFNILNTFKLVNDYIKEITMLLIGLIPLLLLGVVLFGDDFFLGNIVVYNIQNILDSMGGFVGIITLLLIVYFYSRIQVKK